MKGLDFCDHCGASDFLGVECAWPSRACLGTPRQERGRKRPRLRRMLSIAAICALALGLWHIGQAGYIHGKAWAAQQMIEEAWSRTRGGEAQAKPWPWGDTWPVARLRAPAQEASALVLAGANGRSIAFGPGHMFGTAQPGEPGNSVIGAHRDTHFAFLQRLHAGDLIEIETPRGKIVSYRVVGTRVAHKSEVQLVASHGDLRELTLVTCYPFDAIRAGGPLRFVVRAVGLAAEDSSPAFDSPVRHPLRPQSA